MRIRATYELDRETKAPAVNFDVWLFDRDEVEKAVKVLQAFKEILPEKPHE